MGKCGAIKVNERPSKQLKDIRLWAIRKMKTNMCLFIKKKMHYEMKNLVVGKAEIFSLNTPSLVVPYLWS